MTHSEFPRGGAPAAALPAVPPAMQLALATVPPFVLGTVLQRVTRRLAARHPEMLRRMGEHAHRRILIDLTDLPHVLLLTPADLRLSAHLRAARPAHDLRLAGTLSAFLAMMHGTADGDALFFARALTLEGDTAAALALRNAMDDAELDLAEELAALVGPFAALVRPVLTRVERVTGLALHRADASGAAW